MKDSMIGGHEEFIAQMRSRCNRESFKAAVCDMLGWAYQNAEGKTMRITDGSPYAQRYEIRSRQHVVAYGFKTIHTNY